MWNEAYLESKVLSAAPVELVGMLYEGALDAVGQARACLEKGDIAGRSGAIQKALRIFYELAGSLDHTRGGALSRSLAELYAYMEQRLIEANIEQADGPLVETGRLLATLAEAWRNGPAASASDTAQAWFAPVEQYASQAWSRRTTP